MFHGDVLVHGDAASAFKTMADAGIWGVIHKATQTLGVADPLYASRTKALRSVGLLPGAYHFNTGDTVSGQVNHFFDVAQPDGQTLMALDFEDNRASQMTLANAVNFLQLARQKLGRPLWVYSGNRIKDLIVDGSEEVRAEFAASHFWLCEYGAVARMTDARGRALPWKAPTLWQFTGDGIGPNPHSIPGVLTRGIDINSYAGTRDQLAKDWVS
jgi:lysozyme